MLEEKSALHYEKTHTNPILLFKKIYRHPHSTKKWHLNYIVINAPNLFIHNKIETGNKY